VRFEIEADAFLRHMVRTIVGTSTLIGVGKLPVSEMAASLERRERAAAGPTAPAHGLTLLRVTY
jgi:tRNA pseudouridine38-40 synthase